MPLSKETANAEMHRIYSILLNHDVVQSTTDYTPFHEMYHPIFNLSKGKSWNTFIKVSDEYETHPLDIQEEVSSSTWQCLEIKVGELIKVKNRTFDYKFKLSVKYKKDVAETEWSYFYSTLSVLRNSYKDFPIERKKLTYLAVSENGTFRFITANSPTEAENKYYKAFLNNEDYGTHLFQILSVPVTDEFNLWTLFPSLEDFHDDSQGYPYFSNYCHHNGL